MTELDVKTVPGDAQVSRFTLPAPSSVQVNLPVAPTSAPETPKRLRTTWILAATVGSATGAAAIAALQMGRVMDGRERIESLTPYQIALALVAALGVVAWTWMVVENARRLLAAGRTTQAPVPGAVAAAWAVPLCIAAVAVTLVAYLERRLNTADSDTTSAVPLAITFFFLVVGMLVSYRPLFMLSSVMRRLGSASVALARWIWVPIVFMIGGVATLVALRVGGGYGDDFEGVAPAWALGIVALVPLTILLQLAWRGGRAVEDAIGFAFDRRSGRNASGVGRGRLGLFARALRADARPALDLDTRRNIRILPGAEIIRVALMLLVAALTLVSIVGALVMFLFWRESGDGTLLPSQRDRAWTALGRLQTIQRMLAIGLVGVGMIWSFISVLNARQASGRRRNPVLAAVAWPAAAYAIWWLGRGLADTDTVVDALILYALQIGALFVPFFLLERSAIAVGARRSPLRLVFGIAAVLLVHVQGLGGLPTIVEVTEIDRFGRLAGYLALAALLELIATIAITDASPVIADAAANTADKHNFLAEQRAHQFHRTPTPSGSATPKPAEDRRRSTPGPSPTVIAASSVTPPPGSSTG